VKQAVKNVRIELTIQPDICKDDELSIKELSAVSNVAEKGNLIQCNIGFALS
jgi:hypothetical protein